MSDVLVVTVLGVDVAVPLDGFDDGQRGVLRTTWARCQARIVAVPPASASVLHAVVVGSPGAVLPEVPGPFDVVATDFDGLCERLTTSITHLATTARRHDHVLLHAAGLVDPGSGATIAVVGPSGRGKTTAATALAQHLGYLSDETVAVADDGTVLAYPKPLSLKRGPDRPKLQVAPDELGLAPLPPAPAVLRRILVLDRQPGLAVPVLDRVRLTDVLDDVIGQVGFIGARPHPLRRLQGLVDRCGGLFRVRYSEASTLPSVVAHLLRSAAASKLHAVPPAPVPTIGRGVTTAGPDRTEPGAVTWRVGDDVVDWVEDGDDVVVLARGTAVALAGVGALVWRTVVEAGDAALDGGPPGTGITPMTSHAVRVFGAPDDGDPRAIVADAVQTLEHHGLLVRSADALRTDQLDRTSRTPATSSAIAS